MSKSVRKVSKKQMPIAIRRQASAHEREQSSGLSKQDMADRVQAEREQLFKAIAIVELCKLSTATLLETGDPECMVPVLETTCDLLNTSAERLEWISADLQRLSPTGKA